MTGLDDELAIGVARRSLPQVARRSSAALKRTEVDALCLPVAYLSNRDDLAAEGQ